MGRYSHKRLFIIGIMIPMQIPIKKRNVIKRYKLETKPITILKIKDRNVDKIIEFFLRAAINSKVVRKEPIPIARKILLDIILISNSESRYSF